MASSASSLVRRRPRTSGSARRRSRRSARRRRRRRRRARRSTSGASTTRRPRRRRGGRRTVAEADRIDEDDYFAVEEFVSGSTTSASTSTTCRRTRARPLPGFVSSGTTAAWTACTTTGSARDPGQVQADAPRLELQAQRQGKVGPRLDQGHRLAGAQGGPTKIRQLPTAGRGPPRGPAPRRRGTSSSPRDEAETEKQRKYARPPERSLADRPGSPASKQADYLRGGAGVGEDVRDDGEAAGRGVSPCAADVAADEEGALANFASASSGGVDGGGRRGIAGPRQSPTVAVT